MLSAKAVLKNARKKGPKGMSGKKTSGRKTASGLAGAKKRKVLAASTSRPLKRQPKSEARAASITSWPLNQQPDLHQALTAKNAAKKAEARAASTSWPLNQQPDWHQALTAKNAAKKANQQTEEVAIDMALVAAALLGLAQ